MVKSSHDARLAALGGTIAGLVGGVFLTLFMTAMSAMAGRDVWYGMKGASAPFLGERAMSAGFDALPVFLGLATHLAISVFWGIAFAMLVVGLRRGATFLAGVLWAIVVWFGMYYVALPLVGLAAMRNDAPAGRAIAFHLAYSLPMVITWLLWGRGTSQEAVREGGFNPATPRPMS